VQHKCLNRCIKYVVSFTDNPLNMVSMQNVLIANGHVRTSNKFVLYLTVVSYSSNFIYSSLLTGGAGSCLNLVASNTPLIVGKPVALSSSGCPDGGDCRWDFCDQTDGQCVTVCDGKSCKDSRYWFDEAYDLCFIIGNNTAGCYCLIDHHTNNDVQCFEVIIQSK